MVKIKLLNMTINLRLIIFFIASFMMGSKTCAQTINKIEFLHENPTQFIFLKGDSIKNSLFTGTDSFYINQDRIKILIVIYYESGKKIKATGYYDNGQKYRESHFNGSVNDGSDSAWYKNGQVSFSSSYRNGVVKFPYYSWYENGKLKEFNTYDQNKNTGTILEWYPNSILKRQVSSIDTSKGGYIELHYYENGQICMYSELNNGRGINRGYYKNGQLEVEGYFFNLHILQMGKWKEWYENGMLKREYEFSEDEPNVKVGEWKWYNEKGKLIKKENYNLEMLQVEKKH
jgi:antitoxin component YwqK of YwqJK toxin-antitoxin module